MHYEVNTRLTPLLFLFLYMYLFSLQVVMKILAEGTHLLKHKAEVSTSFLFDLKFRESVIHDKCNTESGFTQSHRSATCPQNVLLRVAYPYVRNDVTVEKPQHVCWKQPHHVIDDRFFYPSRTLILLHFVSFDNTATCFILLQQRQQF